MAKFTPATRRGECLFYKPNSLLIPLLYLPLKGDASTPPLSHNVMLNKNDEKTQKCLPVSLQRNRVFVMQGCALWLIFPVVDY